MDSRYGFARQFTYKANSSYHAVSKPLTSGGDVPVNSDHRDRASHLVSRVLISSDRITKPNLGYVLIGL